MLELAVFEDLIRTDLPLVRPDVPEPAMAFLREMIGQTDMSLEFRNADILERFSTGPEALTGTIALCSRETMNDILMVEDNCLGLHMISMPEGISIDGQEGPYLHRSICLVVYDHAELEARLAEEMDEFSDTDDLAICTESWLVTVFHEIEHMRLFQENACGIAPAEIEVMADSGEIGNDIFDMSTGYGIRPLRMESREIWAESADEASVLAETYVEERGRAEAIRILQGDLAPLAFLAAAGVSPDRLLAKDRAPEAGFDP